MLFIEYAWWLCTMYYKFILTLLCTWNFPNKIFEKTFGTTVESLLKSGAVK